MAKRPATQAIRAKRIDIIQMNLRVGRLYDRLISQIHSFSSACARTFRAALGRQCGRRHALVGEGATQRVFETASSPHADRLYFGWTELEPFAPSQAPLILAG